MPNDLGNKMNPFLAGLTGLGEGLFQGFLLKRKQQEEERRFNVRMGMEERQNSLLNDFRLQQAKWAQEERNRNNQQQDYNTYLNAGSNYRIQDQKDFVDGIDQSGNAIPRDAIAGDPKNSYLKGKILIPKTEEQLMTENQRQAKALETRRLDLTEREIKLKELGGGKSELTPYQQEMQDRYNQKKEDNRSEKQQMYNDIMSAEWDGTKNAYIITEKDGTELQFGSDKALEKYVRTQVVKSKIPGKINLWTREQKQAKEKIDIKIKYKAAFQALKNKGYSEQEALDLIKKNEGIK